MQTCDRMILECYWYGIKYKCTELFAERPTDNGFCCSFNTLPMSLQLLVFPKISLFLHFVILIFLAKIPMSMILAKKTYIKILVMNGWT